MNTIRYFLLIGLSLSLASCDGVFYDEPDNSGISSTKGNSPRDLSANKDKCTSNQATVKGVCVDVKITDIKPLAVANNQLTKFTITAENLPNNIETHVEQCVDGKTISQSANNIQYQCRTTVAGEKSLVLVQGERVIFGENIIVANIVGNQIIKLPPKPSNPDKTIVGIDSNNNGVRDEVEIELASYILEADLYEKSLKVAKAYQQILQKSVPATRKVALEIISDVICKSSERTKLKINDKDIYIALTHNTKERKQKQDDFFDKLEGGYLGSELTPCK